MLNTTTLQTTSTRDGTVLCRKTSWTYAYTAPLCAHYLDEMCKHYTRDQVDKSRVMSDLCGCRVPPDKSYLKYTKKDSCDPMCNRVNVAHKVNLATATEDRCNSNVCVNDVTLKLYQSEVNGGAVLNQICGHCGKSGCTCIISGTSIPQVLSDSKLPVVFNQFCSGNSVCIHRDIAGGPDKVVDCNAALKEAKRKADTKKIGPVSDYAFGIYILQSSEIVNNEPQPQPLFNSARQIDVLK